MPTHRLLLLLCLSLLLSTVSARPPTAAMAEQSVPVGDSTLDYTVRWEPMTLGSEDDDDEALISATSYVVEADGDEQRPLVFLFNGGPGASSSPLHFTLGPRRIETDGEGGEDTVPNRDTLLVHADLVFIDPVGTGFSRNRSEATPYWTRHGDAESVAAYIEHWLERHDRHDSPLFVAGESYGAFRLADMMPRLEKLGIRGAMLVSPSLDFSGQARASGNDLPHVTTLPSMAVAAWHHERAHDDLDSAASVWRRARDYAETSYLQALHRGTRLDEDRRHRVADRLAELTGIEPEHFIQHELRLPLQFFLENLVEGMEVGRLDSRVTASLEEQSGKPDRPDGANDPSLGVGPDNKILSEPIRRYLVEEVGVETEKAYFSLNLDLNFAWDWRAADEGPEFYINPARHFGEAMETDEHFALFVVSGYFDLATPTAGIEHSLTRPFLDAGRVEFHFLPTGHSPFSSEAHRPGLVDSLREFIESRSFPGEP